MATNTENQTRNYEENTSAQSVDGPKRDKTVERNYPQAERDAENKVGKGPTGPVQIPVKA